MSRNNGRAASYGHKAWGHLLVMRFILKRLDEDLTCRQFFAAGLGHLFLRCLRFGFPLQAAVTLELSVTPVLNTGSGGPLPEGGGRVLAGGTGGLGGTPG